VNEKRYIIGIDLGTTNSAVSYVDLSVDDLSRRNIEIFKIPQLTGPGEISRMTMLPSFLYISGGHEVSKEAMILPWADQETNLIGAFARDQGARVPKRMVSSAKSWLCHDKVDRKAAILPWGSDEDVTGLSPVEATSAYLRHIKEAWNHSKKGDEDLCLERQSVIITVPASFDEAARDLTVEAACQAGIKNITLIEEPLAAFYSWLIDNEQEWGQFVKPGDLILVCDVGGGTTDFTLITLREAYGNPVFERIAVGDHLILGGDNMDLSLAHRLEMRLQKGQRGPFSVHRWQALCHQCRQAKEDILSGLKEQKEITLVGGGRRLIADTVTTSLDREELEEAVLEGFFPFIEPDENLSAKPRKGLTEFGLPYAQDPAITRHLARFLEYHKEDAARVLGKENASPDLILFNGAALKPAILQDRIRQAIGYWFDQKDDAAPRVLANPELDLAVARGASYYGLVKKGHGVRVGSGSARAYFLGLGKSTEQETGDAVPETAICLIERNMGEGRNIELKDKEFLVLANQAVSFDLFSSSFRTGDRAGDVINVDDSLTPLHPIRTVIQFGKKTKQTSLPVRIEASYTELGTLALWCRSIHSKHRWRLQFQLRNTDQTTLVTDQQILEESLADQALQKTADLFSSKTGDIKPEHLVKIIEKIVKRPRDKWPLNFIRRIADQLIELTHARRLSVEHEIRWYNLIGFCLRPGFGDALDEHRIQKLWKIYHDGPIHSKNAQVRSEWWVLWRRVAGGLPAGQQLLVLQAISPLIKPKKGKMKTKLAPQEHVEIWMTVANLERLPTQDKVIWGRLLLDHITPGKSRPQYWWSISRIGAREPLYGPVDRIILPDEVVSWIETILNKKWRNPRPVGTAMARLASLTGDRKRDLPPEVIERVIEWLAPHEWSGPSIKTLTEVLPIDQQEESIIFGESVPPGIILHESYRNAC